MRVGVLIKQVPCVEAMALGPDGRLIRAGLDLEINAYCRRAISQGVELASHGGGTCTVITLGPPSAEDGLREAVAWGADHGVLVTDPEFAGSDTLATARALAAAIVAVGPFDIILAGRNSVDADTGQVGPEVAQLLGLPFLGGVRAMTIVSGTVEAHLELDDGWADAQVDLPALLSCAERLCPPAKVNPAGRAAVSSERLTILHAGDLGPGPWGQAASPTNVGGVRVLTVERRRLVLSGPVAEQAARAVGLLRDAGVLGRRDGSDTSATAPEVPDDWSRGGATVVVLAEPDRDRVSRELLGTAARLARHLDGHVTGAALAGCADPVTFGSWGADELVAISGAPLAEDVAASLAEWCHRCRPWAVVAPSTMWGREVAARLAARLGAGLTGDAVELAFEHGRLVAWKPAFGGQIVAAVTASSPTQLVTVRPGMLPVLSPRRQRRLPITTLPAIDACRVRVLRSGRDDDLEELCTAPVVIGVGAGVDPDDYWQLEPLAQVLGAELAATRKVTDRGWLPRSRQLGLTGRSISPRLYLAIGLSGKFNHLVGVRSAGQILAVNSDPAAPVFGAADIGLVGDWHEAVPLLAKLIGT